MGIILEVVLSSSLRLPVTSFLRCLLLPERIQCIYAHFAPSDVEELMDYVDSNGTSLFVNFIKVIDNSKNIDAIRDWPQETAPKLIAGTFVHTTIIAATIT